MTRLRQLELLLLRLNQAIIALMMALMSVLVFANVVTRYGLGWSIAWAEEVSRFLMIWTTFLGAGLALREGRHVAIDFLQERLPARPRRGLRIALGLFLIGFMVVIGVYGVQFSIFAWGQETNVTQIPLGIPYLAIPIGAALFTLHLIAIFPDFLTQNWHHDHPDDDPQNTGAAGAEG